MEAELKRLIAITTGCRHDMHEPDEQGISARVIGNKLDNAMGAMITENAILNGWQELCLIIHRDDMPEPEVFNLATLIALARRAKLDQE